MTYKVYLRDENLERIMQVEDFEELAFVLRFNKPGSWVLKVPPYVASRALSLINEQNGRLGIIVEKDGLNEPAMFSGICESTERVNEGNTDQVTFSGPSDDTWLWRRVILPVYYGPPYTASAYDIRTGICESKMREYVNYHIGPYALDYRRVPGPGVWPTTDLLRGTSLTGRGRFHVLGDFLASFAAQGGGLGFRIRQAYNTVAPTWFDQPPIDFWYLAFQIYEPEDLSSSIVFSKAIGNLSSYRYSYSAGEVNYAYIGGGGEGTARTIIERSNPAGMATWGRMEQFIDRRDTTDGVELAAAGDEVLAENGDQTVLSISPIDTAKLQFGVHYNLGDVVTVILDEGASISDVVREVKVTINADGEMFTPVVGTPESLDPKVPKIFRQVASLRKRIRNLETR